MTRRTSEGQAFDFLIPTAAMVAHALQRENCLWGEDGETYYADDDLDDLVEDIDDLDDDPNDERTPQPYDHRVWWMWDENCDTDTCNCGQTSLLCVLEYVEPDERAAMVIQHAEEMRRLYEHFWAGQGLVSGASKVIGEACSSCIVEGTPHVWEIYESACELAEEFGEALAAYAYKLFVGEPLHRHESPN